MNNNILNNQNYVINNRIKIELFVKKHINISFAYIMNILLELSINNSNKANWNITKYIYNIVIILLLSPLLYFPPIWWIIWVMLYLFYSKLYYEMIKSYSELSFIVIWFENDEDSPLKKLNNKKLDIRIGFWAEALIHKNKIILKSLKEESNDIFI